MLIFNVIGKMPKPLPRRNRGVEMEEEMDYPEVLVYLGFFAFLAVVVWAVVRRRGPKPSPRKNRVSK